MQGVMGHSKSEQDYTERQAESGHITARNIYIRIYTHAHYNVIFILCASCILICGVKSPSGAPVLHWDSGLLDTRITRAIKHSPSFDL